MHAKFFISVHNFLTYLLIYSFTCSRLAQRKAVFTTTNRHDIYFLHAQTDVAFGIEPWY